MYSYKNITNYRLKKEFSYKRTHSMSLLTVSINIARELKEYGVEIYFDEEIDLIFSQKAIASIDDERVMLDRKYRAKIEEYKGITNQIEELQIKQKNNEYNVLRLEEMKKALSIKELTPELLTKQIVDAFIAKVIIINRKEIVICLNGNNQFDAKYIKENRKAIVKQKSILDGEVDLPRPFRPEHLHYKVVLL